MFLKKVFKSINSLNNKMKKMHSELKDADNEETVIKNYIAIGKLAKNAKIKAEQVLFLMHKQGLLDVDKLKSAIHTNDRNELKKAISHTMKKNAYNETKNALKKLSTSSAAEEADIARLRKAFGQLANLFDRSLNFKKVKSTVKSNILISKTIRSDKKFRPLVKANWTIKLSKCTSTNDIKQAKKDFIKTISNDLNKVTYFGKPAAQDMKKKLPNLNSCDKLDLNSKVTLNFEQHYDKDMCSLLRAAYDNIKNCIGQAKEKVEKYEKIIPCLNRVEEITASYKDTDLCNNAETLQKFANSLKAPVQGCNMSILDMLHNYYTKYDALYKTINNFCSDPTLDNAYNKFTNNLSHLTEIPGESYFAKVFNKFKDKFQQSTSNSTSKDNTIKNETVNVAHQTDNIERQFREVENKESFVKLITDLKNEIAENKRSKISQGGNLYCLISSAFYKIFNYKSLSQETFDKTMGPVVKYNDIFQ